MEIRSLKYFLEICRAGSIHKAAKELHMSQQGLSRIISSMENSLGGPIFNRSHSGVSMTQHGEILYKYATRIIAQYNEMCDEMGLVFEMEHEQVSIVYAYGVLSQLTMQIPNEFRVDYPEVDLLIGEYPYYSTERMVQDKKYDLGFAYLPIDRSIFDFTSIFKAPWPLLVHKDNPLSQKDTVTCKDISEQNIILMSNSFKGHFTFLNRCRDLGLKLHIIATINDLSESYKWVQNNAGVAFSTFNACSSINDPNLKIITLVDEVCTAEIGIIRRLGEPLSPAAQLFYDYSLRYIAGQSGTK